MLVPSATPGPPWAMSAFQTFAAPPGRHQHQHWQQVSPFSSPTLVGSAASLSCPRRDHLRRRRHLGSCCRQSGAHGAIHPLTFGAKYGREGRSAIEGHPSLLGCLASPTSTPEESSGAAPGSAGTSGSEETAESGGSAAVGSDARRLGGPTEPGTEGVRGRPVPGWDVGYEATGPLDGRVSDRSRGGGGGGGNGSGEGSSSGRRRKEGGPTQGRLRLKWGFDLDVPVPSELEALVKGPWDPQGDVWARQLDIAAQVIERSGGVVFMEQLAPVLNPREGPPQWFRENVVASGGGYGGKGSIDGITTDVVGGEALVLRLLLDLNGVPEVTSDGDILYVFSGFADKSKEPTGLDNTAQTLEDYETDQLNAEGVKGFSTTPEVLQFEEVPKLLKALPKMMPDQGPKVVRDFFQRTALSGLALFLSMWLLLGQLIFHSSPTWLFTGPAYLVWVGLDDTLRRSRDTSARQRDRWRGQWADVCRGDGEAMWRKRAAARSRARRLRDEGV